MRRGGVAAVAALSGVLGASAGVVGSRSEPVHDTRESGPVPGPLRAFGISVCRQGESVVEADAVGVIEGRCVLLYRNRAEVARLCGDYFLRELPQPPPGLEKP